MNDDLVFSDDIGKQTEKASNAVVATEGLWKILIVDDEQEVHSVTKLVLKNFVFEGRKISMTHAYSAKEAKEILRTQQDFAMALIDVVMEHDHAGLQLVEAIREELKLHKIRLVLRTGQPGQAPEETVISKYDINDYKEKTELTNTKLKTLMYATLRAFRDLDIIDHSRRGLSEVIEATGHIAKTFHLERFASAVLEQISRLMTLGNEAIYCQLNEGIEALAAEHVLQRNDFTVIASTESMAKKIGRGQIKKNQLPPEMLALFRKAIAEKSNVWTETNYVGYYRTLSERENLLYIGAHFPLTALDFHLLDIFSSNVAILHERLLNHEDVNRTKRELMYVLGEAVEQRGAIHGSHVRRVAHYAHTIALAMGLNEDIADLIKFAAPLHDIGKVAISDRILTKVEPLTDEEWTLMQTHASVGAEILGYSKRPLIRLAAKIAGQHHEYWDGQGYPKGLKGEAIDIAARIVGFADFFDGVSFDRCYAKAWPLTQTQAFVHEQAGKQFDPKMIAAVEHLWPQLIDIQQLFPQPGDI